MNAIRVFEWAKAWVVATAMYIYGFAKPIQFSDPSTSTGARERTDGHTAEVGV